MSMRWRYGAENRVTGLAGNTISIGDLCFKYGDRIYAVCHGDPMFHWTKTFLGVAMTAAVGDAPVQVATSGVFEFPIDGPANSGDFVTAAYLYYCDGPSDSDTHVAIAPQIVTSCSEAYAVGRAVKDAYYSDDRYYGKRELCVLIELISRAG